MSGVKVKVTRFPEVLVIRTDAGVDVMKDLSS